MTKKKPHLVRLNIYVRDPAIRRHVKLSAAKRDLSVSEYCLRAITTQLVKDGEGIHGGGRHTPLAGAVAKARRFQAETFGGRAFSVSSAQLIREARERRGRR